MEQVIRYLLTIPYYIWSSFIIVFVVMICSLIIRHKVNKLKIGDNPGKVMTGIITFVQFMNNYAKNNIGKHWKMLAPIILSLAIFIFLSNISGLFLLDTPTKYATVTLAFAIVSVITIQSVGLRSKGIKHFKTLMGPMWWFSPVMIPLNILSDLTPLISMTMRLFGNIASGAAVLMLIYAVSGPATVIAGPVAHAIFDIGFGLIQTIVFVLLTTVFSSNKIEESDLEIKGGI
ncbi:F0F1 ATP synthase subunit A [Acholeplasma laidlawii]|uniref:F0F1 ATP synthase subunit A n=1 Tax=Acholeplasma laidlawii TaxID=2148 RepID=UPI0018C1D2E9|nr:F0F1 ATP synthase subunit A [Acholeplasma laidlawii]MBG0763147.1 F0F1 ATP synthase subunit A [Acholeplasma laidlawii]WIF88022.1 F0F1 ATP synthase subunit A [Acholeplasma laidlawii]